MRPRSILAALALTATAVVTVDSTEPPVAHAVSVPAGFADSFVASASSPTAVEWLPSGQIVVLEQGGRIRIARPGEPFRTAIDLAVCSGSERGLLGLTPDPSFLGNGFVYVYYTAPVGGGCVNRVSRFHLVGNSISRQTEVVLIDNISSINGNHNGGDLDIGSDGFLYVAVGDAGRDPRGDSGSAGSNDAAQDRSLLNGKILRLTLDGAPAPGNPLSGPGTVRCGSRGNTAATPTTLCQEIFAWGLRNPYRIAFDRNDGSDRFFINDVGQRTYEEVNLGVLGGNYGWPSREGPCAQGAKVPCSSASGVVDPISFYGRGDGTFITAGAFTPNGLWPRQFDGTYLFGDGGSGRIWVRDADADVQTGIPFATGAFGLTDMTFGFDEDGRMVLYYVRVGGSLRKISPTDPLVSTTADGLKMIPIEPFRAYDTESGTGVAAGAVVNGSVRRVDLNPPAAYEAALVNLTYAATTGPGFIRTWGTRAARPGTSSVNADRPFSFVANAAVVPLDPEGSFVLESMTTGRVIVDVMAWFDDTGGASDDGRFVAREPRRLVDTREAAGTILDSGSTNPFTRTSSQIDIDVAGSLGVPDDGTAGAVVVSIGAIAGPGTGGFVGAFPAGTSYGGTSNVNVLNGDVRGNLVVVPLGAGGAISLRTLNIADVVVDVLGYVTSDAAPSSGTGLYASIDPRRVVDTRIPQGFGRLSPLSTATVSIPGGSTRSAVVQNVTVTETSAAGWVAAHPTATPGDISNVNFIAPGQSRAALAFTQLTPAGQSRYTSLVTTHLVVDAVGFFSE